VAPQILTAVKIRDLPAPIELKEILGFFLTRGHNFEFPEISGVAARPDTCALIFDRSQNHAFPEISTVALDRGQIPREPAIFPWTLYWIVESFCSRALQLWLRADRR